RDPGRMRAEGARAVAASGLRARGGQTDVDAGLCGRAPHHGHAQAHRARLFRDLAKRARPPARARAPRIPLGARARAWFEGAGADPFHPFLLPPGAEMRPEKKKMRLFSAAMLAMLGCLALGPDAAATEVDGWNLANIAGSCEVKE